MLLLFHISKQKNIIQHLYAFNRHNSNPTWRGAMITLDKVAHFWQHLHILTIKIVFIMTPTATHLY